MDYQTSSSSLQLLWQTALVISAIFFLSTASYQSIWYLRPVALLFFLFLATKTLDVFIFLFLFRYLRLLVNLVAFFLYQPVAISYNLELRTTDATVIVPTVGPCGKDFEECIRSIHTNGPARIVIVTAGPNVQKKVAEISATYSNIVVKHCNTPNKRMQICEALSEVNTAITVLCDDHVFWPENFLPSILAPFANARVGCVGTQKRVRRTGSDFSFPGFWNFLGCIYLERHNFEIRATNVIDGGVFVVSGRTSAHRSAILKDDLFKHGFTNEYILFGLVGPLNADDDNFITHWMIEHDWEIKIQYFEEACIETTLGEFPKFLSQCMRWSRTTWRSNPRILLSKQVWKTQPWCIYAIYVNSLVSFALSNDAALVYTLWKRLTRPGTNPIVSPFVGELTLCLFIFGTKLIKPWPHFRRHPRDLWYLPGYILFVYFHSLVKLWALLTFWNIAWGSRPLNAESEGKGAREGDVAGIDLSEDVIERG